MIGKPLSSHNNNNIYTLYMRGKSCSQHMKNVTNPSTSMYHFTIDWLNQILLSTNRPLCHILGINVGITIEPIKASSCFTMYPTKVFLGPNNKPTIHALSQSHHVWSRDHWTLNKDGCLWISAAKP